MFAKLSEKLAARSAVASVAPEHFQDPLALKAAWIPLKTGGANFQTSKLHQVSPTRWEFRPSAFMMTFSGLFVVVGVAVAAYAVNKHPVRLSESWNRDFLFLMGFGLFFALVGALVAYSSSVPTVFDKDHGYFSKSRKKPEHMADPSTLKNFVELKRVHAIQLLAEKCRGDNSSYLSYELNLVLDDASRMNVIDHGNLQAVRDDARLLSEFLGKPVWDSI